MNELNLCSAHDKYHLIKFEHVRKFLVSRVKSTGSLLCLGESQPIATAKAYRPLIYFFICVSGLASLLQNFLNPTRANLIKR